MANARKRRRRAQVERSERVKPPPEAAQHHRPWPMQLLLQAGPEGGGIDADEFEAALQIVETYKALVRTLDIAAAALERIAAVPAPRTSMSDRDAELIACWFDWSQLLPRGLPPRLVHWVEDDEPIGSVAVLRRACRLWDRCRSERAKGCPPPVDKTAPGVLTISRALVIAPDFNASPVNLPVHSFRPPAGPTYRPALSMTCAGPMCPPSGDTKRQRR